MTSRPEKLSLTDEIKQAFAVCLSSKEVIRKSTYCTVVFSFFYQACLAFKGIQLHFLHLCHQICIELQLVHCLMLVIDAIVVCGLVFEFAHPLFHEILF